MERQREFKKKRERENYVQNVCRAVKKIHIYNANIYNHRSGSDFEGKEKSGRVATEKN